MSETPAVLLPYQQAWVADRSPVKICEKSRRVGLSWADASDSALTAGATRSAGGMNCWYIGYNQDMAREYVRDVGEWARQFHLAAGELEEELLRDEDRDILTFVVKFASGFRVTALSSRPSNLRGKQGRIIIDEAAFHDDLPALLKAAMALLIWGGRVAIISTHDGDLNPFNELILDVRAGKAKYSLHRVPFREALAEGLYRRICLVTGRQWSQAAEDAWVSEMYAFYRDDAAEELDCIPSSGEGAYLTRALIESRMHDLIPVLRLSLPNGFEQLARHLREAEVRDWCRTHLDLFLDRLPPALDHFFGSDFARRSDLSVLWVLEQRRDLTFTTPFLIELRNVPFEQQRQIVSHVLNRLPRFVGGAMDESGNGMYLAEVTRQEFGASRIDAVSLNQGWYREHMPRVKAAFEDGTIEVPKDADVLADLRALRKANGIAKVPEDARYRGADGETRHGDTAIALALALYAAATLEGAPIEYTGVPPKAARWDGKDDDEDHDVTLREAGAW